ncbi:MAG: hypothetical protein MK186_10205, partial [Henriciella sp.]|nr:hypothetical protein [Henriciella sp.]
MKSAASDLHSKAKPNRSESRDYGSAAPTKIKRVLLGVFLCGIAASLLVALIAGIALFGITITADIAGSTTYGMSSGDGFLAGAFLSLAFCSLNWFVFYIVVPVTWIVLAFSIGRFPRRGIGRPAAYLRWSAISGALLAGGVSSLFTLNIEYTEITDAGLAHLKTLSKLETLILRGTEITDEGLVHEEQLKTLTTLDVEYAPVSKQGQARHQKAL